LLFVSPTFELSLFEFVFVSESSSSVGEGSGVGVGVISSVGDGVSSAAPNISG
jgi:hypothetical protein